MQGMERKAYKDRFYPTEEQARELARTFGCVRYVYNWALALRTEAWFERHERIDYVDLAAALVRLKKEPEKSWLAEVSCVPLQQSLRHLNAAFLNFFAGRTKYPRFHRKHDRQWATYTKQGFRWKDGALTLAKMDAPLDIRWSRAVGADPTSVTVSRDPAGRYLVSFSTEEEVAPLPVVNATVGIDLGLLDAVAMSTGGKVGNERFFRQDEERLARAQRSLARKRKGSRNRGKARLKVARIHARIADRRRDFTHKLTTRIIRENQVVCAESLNVKGMLAHPTLAKSIADVGWGELLRQLEYKARWYGRTFVQIDRFYPSSKRCHACGHVADHLPLEVRYWECPACGAALDRDVNAAQNIRDAGLAELAAGLAVSACGGDVRPTRKRVGGLRRSRKPR